MAAEGPALPVRVRGAGQKGQEMEALSSLEGQMQPSCPQTIRPDLSASQGGKGLPQQERWDLNQQKRKIRKQWGTETVGKNKGGICPRTLGINPILSLLPLGKPPHP